MAEQSYRSRYYASGTYRRARARDRRRQETVRALGVLAGGLIPAAICVLALMCLPPL